MENLGVAGWRPDFPAREDLRLSLSLLLAMGS